MGGAFGFSQPFKRIAAPIPRKIGNRGEKILLTLEKQIGRLWAFIFFLS